MEVIRCVVDENRARRGMDDGLHRGIDDWPRRDIDDWPSMQNPRGRSKNSPLSSEDLTLGIRCLGKDLEGVCQEQSQHSEKLIQMEERLEKLEKALIHSVMHEERIGNLENKQFHQASSHASKVPSFDTSQAEIEDFQRWRAKVDEHIQNNGREKVAADDDYSRVVGDSHVHKVAADEDYPRLHNCNTHVFVKESGGNEGAAAPDRQVSPTGEEKRHSFTHRLPVKLRECVWDYTFLIGLPENSYLGSLMVLQLTLCSVFLQGFLCLVINDLFTVPIVSDNIVSEMHDWRLHVAHRAENMDVNKGVPLARSVCSLDVPTSGSASQFHDLIATYLPTEEYYESQEPLIGPMLPYMYHIGIGLSTIACIIWCLRIVEDLDDIFDIAQAVSNLPVSESTEIEYSAKSVKVLAVSRYHIGIGLSTVAYIIWCLRIVEDLDDIFDIDKAVSNLPVSESNEIEYRQRKIWYFSMLLLEVAGLSFLGFTGVAYIVNTLQLTDLLLNCSALAIVLDMDTYVAHCMPKIFQVTLEGMEPIVRPIGGRFWGAGPESLGKVAIVFVLSMTATLVMLSGVQLLEDARVAICGGNLDFIVAEDTSGVIIAIQTSAVHAVGAAYIDRAMEQLLHHGDRYVQSPFGKEDMSSQAVAMRGGPGSFEEWVEMSPEVSSAYWNPDCVDMLPVEDSPYSYSGHFKHILNDVHMSNTPISHCSQVQQYCVQTTSAGERVRQFCPATCGCDDPGYKLYWEPSEYACPESCLRSAAYNSSLWSRECEDLDVSSPVWSQFHDGLRAFFAGYGSTMDQSLARIKDLGCQAISTPVQMWGRSWQDLCQASPNEHFKGLTWACPVSCNCKECRVGACTQFCPNKCRVGASRR